MDTADIESRCANIAIEDEEIVELDFARIDVLDSRAAERTTWSMVGRFLTNRPVKFDAMRNVLAAVWRPVLGLTVTEIKDNLYRFDFYHEKDLLRVLDEGPWAFENHSLVCRRIEPGDVATDIKLENMDIWVQVYGLPEGYATDKVLEHIGNHIGQMIEGDPKNFEGAWKCYLRVRVSIDISRPLKRRIKIKKRDGTYAWVSLKYERLHIFCFYCGLLGHQAKFCAKAVLSNATPEQYPYGPKLRAPQRRSNINVGSGWLVAGPRQERALEGLKREGRWMIWKL